MRGDGQKSSSLHHWGLDDRLRFMPSPVRHLLPLLTSLGVLAGPGHVQAGPQPPGLMQGRSSVWVNAPTRITLPSGWMQGRSLCCLRTEPPGGKAGCVVPPDAPCRPVAAQRL